MCSFKDIRFREYGALQTSLECYSMSLSRKMMEMATLRNNVLRFEGRHEECTLFFRGRVKPRASQRTIPAKLLLIMAP